MEKLTVRREVIEAILDTARDGEAQVVQYSKDNCIMATRAAELSKRKCGEIIEALLLILTGQDVSLESQVDDRTT